MSSATHGQASGDTWTARGFGAAVRELRALTPTAHEVREVAVYLALVPVAWLPDRPGLWARDVLARFLMRPGSAYRRHVSRAMPAAIRQRLRTTGRDPFVVAEAAKLADELERVRRLVAPFRHRTVDVRGFEYLRTALGNGRGAILWVQPCPGASVLVKRATSECGAPVVHLSSPGHPFSGTAFGRKVMGPLLCRAETPFVLERVVMSDGGRMGALRRLRGALARNHPVSITVTPSASRVLTTPCLGGVLVLPAGPVELAAVSGAPLLPVFMFGAPAAPVVVIGAPLPVDGKGQASVATTHGAAAAWIEGLVLAHPEAWSGWRSGVWRAHAAE